MTTSVHCCRPLTSPNSSTNQLAARTCSTWLPTDDSTAVFDLKVDDCGLISDHRLVVFEMKFRTHRGQPIKYFYRNLKNLDVDALADAVRRSSLFTSSEPTVNSYTDHLVDVVSCELDQLAPLRTVTRRQSMPATKWLSDEAVKAKRVRRRYENIWKSSNAESD